MVGAVYIEEGVGLVNEKVKLVKKIGEVGGGIQNHNHPGYDILFTVVKGRVEVKLNTDEKYVLEPGSVLSFDGENKIEALFLEKSEVFVTLVKQ